MKTKKNKTFIASIVFLLFFVYGPHQAIAQNTQGQPEEFNRFSFGLGGGVVTSFTDVKENPLVPVRDEIAYGGKYFLNFHLSPALTLQTTFLYGEMKGVDSKQDLAFETSLIEAALNARVSFNSLLMPESGMNQKVNLYGFAGAGLLAYRSRLMENDTPVDYYGYTDGGYTKDDLKPALMVPFGVGVNFKISDRFDIGLETGFRYTRSDRLDAMPVDGTRNDIYNFTGIGLTIRLGRNTNSMDWAPPSQTMYPGDMSRVDDLERRVETIADEVESFYNQHEQHDQEMNDLKVRVDGVSQEKAEIMQRTVRLFGAVEDLKDAVKKLSAELEQQKEAAPEQYYAVQVMAMQEEISVEEARQHLGITHDMRRYYINGYHKFVSGRYDNLEDAILHMQRIWGQGVRDAFVVEYRDGMLYPR